MSEISPSGVSPNFYALNRTRQQYLATHLAIAQTHFSRLRGLLGVRESGFGQGHGLWLVPSHGIHTFGMRFPLDIVYLDQQKVVVYLQQDVRPWRMAPVRRHAASVLELPRTTIQATGTSLGDEIEIAMDKTMAEKITT
ncbi:MAG: DUF192 domain-containing protein [Acidobacteriota bacterium]|jgi:uncharacterized membrane protein (UPF0127 family)|nr:DUF192 domain-containing protein [Acidobacteriota bacterium]